MMRRIIAALVSMWVCTSTALANPTIDRLVDAMGVPALVQAFATEGETSAVRLDEEFLNRTGGAVWAETVRKLYDPARLEAELRSGLAQTLDPQVAETALIFFESDPGQRIVTLEIQARAAMVDQDVEDMARAAGAAAGPQVTDFIAMRELVDRNTDAALAAQTAFFDGLAETAVQPFAPPDLEGQRPMVADDTEGWLRGYYALIQSALSDEDIQTYIAFWNTQVGRDLDAAIFEAFGESYESLSFALGQAVGHLIPPNEL